MPRSANHSTIDLTNGPTIRSQWKTALSVLSAYLNLPPNFLGTSYEAEIRRPRLGNEKLPPRIEIPYQAGLSQGKVIFSWYEEPANICYIGIRVKTDTAYKNKPPTDVTEECMKWLVISSTSVQHVIQDGANCPLWLEVVRGDDGEVSAEHCCEKWKRNLDPSSPMTAVEKQAFAFIDLEPKPGSKKLTLTITGRYKTQQIALLREMLERNSKKSEEKIRILEARVKLLEKLLGREGLGDGGEVGGIGSAQTASENVSVVQMKVSRDDLDMMQTEEIMQSTERDELKGMFADDSKECIKDEKNGIPA